MAQESDLSPQVGLAEAVPRRRRWRRALGLAGLAALVLPGAAWLSRERIADNVIAAQLHRMGLPASYRIERIGGTRQVLGQIRIGDPARPDLTIERAEVTIGYSFGFPKIIEVKLVRPRLYGSYLNRRLSFGALDKVLFAPAPAGEPAHLPDLDLTLEDGRAQLLTDYGNAGFKLDGKGNLHSGFAGQLAAIAPDLRTPSCALRGVSAFGALSVTDERPAFSGPVRLAALRCPASGVSLDDAAIRLDASTSAGFDTFAGEGRLRAQRFAVAATRADALALDGKASWKGGALNASVTGDLGGVEAGGLAIARLGIDGQLRGFGALNRIEVRGALDGSGVAPGPRLEAALAGAQRSLAGTLFAPLLGQTRQALRQERGGSRLTADVTWRQTGSLYSLVVPSALLRGGSGAALLSLSRFQVAGGRRGIAPLVSGNFAAGGPGLPQVAGRMERGPQGRAMLRMTMAPYRAGGGSLALPELVMAQGPDGSLGFAGKAVLSGALPGGYARNLALPLDGRWGADGELAVFRRCITPTFDELAVSSLVLDKRSLTLCPGPSGAIVRSGAGGLKIAAGATSLSLTGRLGQSPISIAGGPVGFAWPGAVAARSLDIALGPPDTASRFRLGNVTATLGKDVSGTFAGADLQLFAVPLDIAGAEGTWRYAGQKLAIAGAAFTLKDRSATARFNPLVARDAALTLLANRIEASAVLRDPASGHEVLRTAIRHDLASGAGHADLFVDALTFDKSLQPDRITPLVLGVVTNVAGTVAGKGAIDWNPGGMTSTGAFSTDGLDLAAAFGPVRGLSGTVRFTDLLGLVTEPGQTLRIASVNPGIEVTDGTLAYALRPGLVLRVEGGRWPFMGGTLRLEPVDLNLGLAETRRYTLAIEGLDSAQFVRHMDLENISATGTFDGELPLVFDANGGRIEGGMLTSRAPGGNVSYVGALTYKDLSAMANFAFDALKSLDYTHMSVGVDGAIDGEIVTRVRFDGVRQGAGARRNFATRSLGKLPIQFNVNVTAPFYSLITSVKGLYDATYLEDPHALGLVDGQGRAIAVPAGKPKSPPPGDVQPPDSGTMP